MRLIKITRFNYERPLLLVLLGGSLFFPFCFPVGGQSAVVTAVYDGDTLKVRLSGGKSEIVRLIGIDAPELDDSRGEAHFFALMSKRFTFTNLYGKNVRLEYDWERRDQYGRLLAYVFLRGSLFNEFMIRQGYATALLKYPFRDDYRMSFKAAQQDARDVRRGLWRNTPYPIKGPENLGRHLGELLRVRFICDRVEEQGRYAFLRARGADFAALVERRDLDRFPPLEQLIGQSVTVSGLVEEYRGHPQLVLFLPLQLQTERHRENLLSLTPDSGTV